jgi:hypothetical protein
MKDKVEVEAEVKVEARSFLDFSIPQPHPAVKRPPLYPSAGLSSRSPLFEYPRVSQYPR